MDDTIDNQEKLTFKENAKPILCRLRNLLGSSCKVNWPTSKSTHFVAEQKYLEQIIYSSVLGDPETGIRRSNSVIVFGPAGSGKTTLVENSLTHLSENEDFYDKRSVIRLSGLLCLDFKSSVEEICWKLSNSMFESSNIDDSEAVVDATLQRLEDAKNFDARLEIILDILKSSRINDETLIFVLDNLEKFAEHPNQMLLYILFDIAANFNTIPICIIGLTQTLDVVEMFEKRVKSRFSHRQINLSKIDFENYYCLAKSFLKYNNNDGEKLLELSADWNNSIEQLFSELTVRQIFQNIFDANTSIKYLRSFLLMVVLGAEDIISLSDFKRVFDSYVHQSDEVNFLLDLNIVDLFCLLSIYKQMKHNKHTAWQPKGIRRLIDNSAQDTVTREDFLKSISKLEGWKFIKPISSAQRSQAGLNYVGDMYYKCNISMREIENTFKQYPHLPNCFNDL